MRINVRRQKAKAAQRKAWAASANVRAKQIAVCPHCPTWFPTVAARNEHRASLPRTPKHQKAA